MLHHLLIAAIELDRSRKFYCDVLGLREIERPNFPYPGAWFEFGNGLQLHLVVRADATLRGQKAIDSYDVHFAVRVKSYAQTLASLRAKGFREDAPESDIRKMILRPDSITGNPQIYILDPDRNIVEFNCESLDSPIRSPESGDS
jgi:glyoxylase I family protein